LHVLVHFIHNACNSTMLSGETLPVFSPWGVHLHNLATPMVPGIGI